MKTNVEAEAREASEVTEKQVGFTRHIAEPSGSVVECLTGDGGAAG